MVMPRSQATPGERANAASALSPELADFISVSENVNADVLRLLLQAEQLINYWNANGLSTKLSKEGVADQVALAFDGLTAQGVIDFINALKVFVRAFGDGQVEPRRDPVAGAEASLLKLARRPLTVGR